MGEKCYCSTSSYLMNTRVRDIVLLSLRRMEENRALILHQRTKITTQSNSVIPRDKGTVMQCKHFRICKGINALFNQGIAIIWHTDGLKFGIKASYPLNFFFATTFPFQSAEQSIRGQMILNPNLISWNKTDGKT